MATRHGWSKRSEGRLLTGRHLQSAREDLFASNPYCVHCNQRGILKLAEERDHIIPLYEGGMDEAGNTQGLCIDCHKVKTRAESNMARGAETRPVTVTGKDGMPLDSWHHWNGGAGKISGGKES